MVLDVINLCHFLVKKKLLPENICNIFIDNKSIEKIYIAFSMKSSGHFHTPAVAYTLTNSIGSRFFNFNKFVNNLNVKGVLRW